jgi:glycosyltransferase involved in cell wall biosynthesis
LLKVCHIICSYPPPPAPVEYARNLVNLGIDVTWVNINTGGDQGYLSRPDEGIRMIEVPIRKGRFKPNWMKFILALKTELSGLKFDITHVYAFRGCGLLPWLLSSISSNWLLDIRTGSVDLSFTTRYVKNLLTHYESYCFKNLTCLDKSLGKMIFGRHRNFHVVPLGANFRKFADRRDKLSSRMLGIEDDRVIIIYVGNLNKNRHPTKILKAFSKAVKQCPRLFFLVVGSGTELETLKAMSLSQTLQGNVELIGQVDHDSLSKYLSCSDIALSYIPKNGAFENQPPLKTVEYLASGLPTVATSTAGNKCFIKDGINGILVEDSAEDIARGICDLAQNEAKRNSMRAVARDSVKDYDYGHIVETTLYPLYAKILSNGGSGWGR